MNLREFKRRINKAEKDLINIRNGGFLANRYNGVCEALSRNFPRDNAYASQWGESLQKPAQDFSTMFAPLHTRAAYWLGPIFGDNARKCREERIFFLRNFEQWAITYGTYRYYGDINGD